MKATNDAGLRHLLTTLRPEIDAALAVIAKKHNLQQLRIGKGTFNPDAGNFSFKMEGIAADGKDKDAAMLDECRRYDDTLPQLGDTFTHSRLGVCTVRGINTTGTKIKITDAAGKKWDFKTDAAKQMIGREKNRTAPKSSTVAA